jgi:diaminopimelate epimerase
MNIPFVKAAGAGNDFLLTWSHEAPGEDHAGLARAICDRHSGVGADGWYLLQPADEASGFHASLTLYNSDGSRAELSGNGTRCAAALLVDSGIVSSRVTLLTGAGPRNLVLLDRRGPDFLFEMNMGRPLIREEEIRWSLLLETRAVEVTILNGGNPQCAVFVEDFPEQWQAIASEIEGHARFENRSNVSFVRVLDRHTIEARFYERGAGETLSSGTGATGAAVAAIARGLVESPVRILTPAGGLDMRWDQDVFLTGPARLVARGQFFWPHS